MTGLILTRGLPASGKTTFARRWVGEQSRRARVNRDDLRAQLFDGEGILDRVREELVTEVQRSMVQSLLKSGVSVIVDDTNLRLKYARAWADLAAEVGVDFDVVDMTTSAETCIRWDADRALAGGRGVGADVIHTLAQKFPSTRWPTVEPTSRPPAPHGELVEPRPDLPSAVLVDLDGTLCLNTSGRSWYDGDVSLDTPNVQVVRLVRDLFLSGERIIFCSGRDDSYRKASREWLTTHVGLWAAACQLLMRPERDTRKDAIVKRELFDTHIRGSWDVRLVLDDRDQVVAMWRGLGLTCLQVAPGAF